jgi:hypothetical protein
VAMKHMFAPVALALGATLVLSGCQASAKDSYDDWSVSPDVGMGSDMAVTEQFAPESAAVTGERFDIITGDLYLTVDNTAETADRITVIVTDAGGRVDSRTDYLDASTQSPSSYLWVRIPTPVLDDTMASIQALGQVERVSTGRMDVTLQVIDLGERIDVLNASLGRLEALLEQATTTAELIELESAITQRQAERDSLVSQQTYLSDQIQFASMSIELRTEGEAPPREPDGFLDAIVAGWFALVAFGGSSVIFLGMALPWIAVAAVVLVPLTWVLVRRRAKKKEKTAA